EHPRLPARSEARNHHCARGRRARPRRAGPHAGGGSARARLMVSPAPMVVVGAGISGLCVALAAAPRPVLLLGRGTRAEDSASVLAQGGIAAALGEGDNVEAHVRDTLAAGAACNEPALVRTLATGAADAVAWLATHGVAFDRDADGLLLGTEGGHG